MTTEAARFRERAEAKARDGQHRKLLLRVIDNYDGQARAMKAAQFRDWQRARALAETIKDAALDALPELLVEFERRATARGTQVLWAEDAEEARRFILGVIARTGARRVVKSKSMTSEEVELNELLEGQGVEVVESDLGELIVQLAHEKPYHIVTPAMHKTRVEISELFTQELGSEPSHDPNVLTAVARRHLRGVYTSADIGITGANFIVAGDGSIAITENEGNARLSVACPRVHIALVGIEKVIPRLSDLALFWPLLATSGTGQQITCYSSIVRGPRAPGERDGPEEMIVILLDNGRSRLYGDPKFRQSLRCIRCGACLNVCPVFRTVGGHSYATPYSGPIGSVITPQLRSLPNWHHLSFASSLCGACSDACPVGIDLHHLLLENRARATAEKHTSTFWRLVLVLWAHLMLSRFWLGFARRVAVLGGRYLPFLLPRSHRVTLGALPRRTFRDWHRDRRNAS